MESPVIDQLSQLAAAFLTGGGVGLWFDLLQPLRPGGGKWTGILWDALFVLGAGGAVFLAGQITGAGGRLFFLCGVGGGAWMYLWALHGPVRDFQLRTKHFLQIKLGKIKESAAKIPKAYKNK